MSVIDFNIPFSTTTHLTILKGESPFSFVGTAGANANVWFNYLDLIKALDCLNFDEIKF